MARREQGIKREMQRPLADSLQRTCPHHPLSSFQTVNGGTDITSKEEEEEMKAYNCEHVNRTSDRNNKERLVTITQG